MSVSCQCQTQTCVGHQTRLRLNVSMLQRSYSLTSVCGYNFVFYTRSYDLHYNCVCTSSPFWCDMMIILTSLNSRFKTISKKVINTWALFGYLLGSVMEWKEMDHSEAEWIGMKYC